MEHSSPPEHQLLPALQAISSHIGGIFDPEQLLDEVVQSTESILGRGNTILFMVDREHEELYLAASRRPLSPETKHRRVKIGFESEEGLGRVALRGEPLLIPDVEACDGYAPSDPTARSAMVAPMVASGQMVGLLEVLSSRPQAFSEQDLQMTISLANQAAAAIEAARLLQESRANTLALERWTHRLMTINRIAATLASLLDAQEILNLTIQHLVELSGVGYGIAVILEQDGQHGLIAAEYPTRQLINLRLPFPGELAARRKLEIGIPHILEDAGEHPLLEPIRERLPSLDVHNLLLVPMLARGEMIGVLLLTSLHHPRTFSQEDMDIYETVASQAAVAVANARLFRDVQQQRRALIRESQELIEESSKLDAILHNVADGLVVTDTSGHIIVSNPAFREMVGLPSTHALRGHLLAESFHVVGLQALVEKALEGSKGVFTENLKLADGRVLKTTATALRIRPTVMEPEKGEQVGGVVIILRDITHEVEVDRMKTEFISAVSHELRSPLTAILGFTNLIQRDFGRWIIPEIEADQKARQSAERILQNLVVIENESQRLTRLINEILDIAKMEAGQMDWPMDRTDLMDVIESAVSAVQALAKEKEIPIEIDVPTQRLPPVWGHRDRLVQVMTNLLSNAIKFTEQGRIQVSCHHAEVLENGERHPEALRLEPGTIPAGEWIVVNITDTGIGIRRQDLAHVFDKFSQFGDMLTEKPQGTGLGLAICKEIVEYHQGHIWAESESGRGSTFSFALPTDRKLQ